MEKKCMVRVVLAVMATFVFAAGAFGMDAEDVKKKFKTMFKELEIEIASVQGSGVAGMYELISEGNEVLYFFPESGHLVYGKLFDSSGSNLTRIAENRGQLNKLQSFVSAKNQAIKIGSGPVEIIEITNPDCGYCRKLSEFLDLRKDVTRYVFFAIDESAAQKAKYVVAAKNKAKALKEVMSGIFDDSAEFAASVYDDHGVVATHMKLVTDAAIEGTPVVLVNGSLVMGADLERIEELIKRAGTKHNVGA